MVGNVLTATADDGGPNERVVFTLFDDAALKIYEAEVARVE